MKKIILLLVVAFQCICCASVKSQKISINDISGVYIPQSFIDKIEVSGLEVLELRPFRLELYSDGTYALLKPVYLYHMPYERCDYASKGRWSVVANNVVEITSENYYTRQKGFEYEIKKENKFSQDSLYIQVIFPTDFHPVTLNFMFNYNVSRSIETKDTCIVVPKNKHLWDSNNRIIFSMDADISGTTLYGGRISFDIFNEKIDTDKYNFLTIELPYFDRCFFEFEPYRQEFILIKNRNHLQWQGKIWKKEFENMEE